MPREFYTPMLRDCLRSSVQLSSSTGTTPTDEVRAFATCPLQAAGVGEYVAAVNREGLGLGAVQSKVPYNQEQLLRHAHSQVYSYGSYPAMHTFRYIVMAATQV